MRFNNDNTASGAFTFLAVIPNIPILGMTIFSTMYSFMSVGGSGIMELGSTLLVAESFVTEVLLCGAFSSSLSPSG